MGVERQERQHLTAVAVAQFVAETGNFQEFQFYLRNAQNRSNQLTAR